jgi:hypothetical protein
MLCILCYMEGPSVNETTHNASVLLITALQTWLPNQCWTSIPKVFLTPRLSAIEVRRVPTKPDHGRSLAFLEEAVEPCEPSDDTHGMIQTSQKKRNGSYSSSTSSS